MRPNFAHRWEHPKGAQTKEYLISIQDSADPSIQMSDTLRHTQTHSDTPGLDPVILEKEGSKARTWCFTINNHTVSDIDTLGTLFEQYVFQEETGECGTPHLQGVCRFKNARSFKAMKKMHPKAHWSVCENWLASIKYCSKTDTRTGQVFIKGVTLPKTTQMAVREKISPLAGKELYPWQKEVMDIIASEPHPRHIHWFVDKQGGRGKTTLVRHIIRTRKQNDVILINGRAIDMKYGIAQMVLKQKQDPHICLLNYSRTQEDRVSYQGLEECKDGLFYSTKYECGQIDYDPPHMIVFANFKPDFDALSADRWIVHYMDEKPKATPLDKTGFDTDEELEKIELEIKQTELDDNIDADFADDNIRARIAAIQAHIK